ncbi:hypothetical protein BDV09DRAFT_163328 [Aspergillus tetrazonus]
MIGVPTRLASTRQTKPQARTVLHRNDMSAAVPDWVQELTHPANRKQTSLLLVFQLPSRKKQATIPRSFCTSSNAPRQVDQKGRWSWADAHRSLIASPGGHQSRFEMPTKDSRRCNHLIDELNLRSTF